MRKGPELIEILRFPTDIASTYHLARRLIISGLAKGIGKKWTTYEVVEAHNYLLTQIIKRGVISEKERELLKAINDERLENYGRVYEVSGVNKVTHSDGLGTFRQQRGRTEYTYGEARLQFWGNMKLKSIKKIKERTRNILDKE